jgi:hypothetical protein
MTNRYSFYAAVVLRPFSAVMAMIRAAYDKYVPIGYEDENGSHLASKPLLLEHDASGLPASQQGHDLP